MKRFVVKKSYEIKFFIKKCREENRRRKNELLELCSRELMTTT
jgi:hypothetical protein